jgi:hypothetical protein
MFSYRYFIYLNYFHIDSIYLYQYSQMFLMRLICFQKDFNLILRYIPIGAIFIHVFIYFEIDFICHTYFIYFILHLILLNNDFLFLNFPEKYFSCINYFFNEYNFHFFNFGIFL